MKSITSLLVLSFLTITLCVAQDDEASLSSRVATENVPIMTFENRIHNFGKIEIGEKPSYTYKFTNTGDKDLVLEFVSGCDCTEIDWPDGKTFKPGESGEIKIVFMSQKEEERGKLEKVIDIFVEGDDPVSGYPVIEQVKYLVEL